MSEAVASEAPARPGPGPRLWSRAALAVAVLAALSRLWNAQAYWPLRGYDGPAHAANVFALYEGRLPTPGSWLGFHPPLYHALGAGLWRLLPDAVPVHAGLRLLSAALGFGAVAIAWRVLRDFVDEEDAAVVAAFLLGVPVFALATSMVGNEAACMLFVTAVLARLTRIPVAAEPRAALGHALRTAGLAGLAALSKTTGFVAAGLAAATYALRLRARVPTALAAAALVGALPLGMAGPFFAPTLLAAGGSPAALVTGAASSTALESLMAAQPPSERFLRDYFSFPAAALHAPVFKAEGLIHSVPGLLYASVWSDAHAHFLIPVTEGVLRVESAIAWAGLIPTGLGLLGLGLLLRRRDPRLIGPLLFAAVMGVALLRYTWILPSYSAVKASYLLPALLPVALCVACGLARLPGGWRQAGRAALLGLGVAGTAVTTWGWHLWTQ